MGHFPGHLVKREDIHRAQNTFRLRALLLRSLEQVGEWEDLVEGIEIGINTILTVHAKEVSLDDFLSQVHHIGKSVCCFRDPTSSSDDTAIIDLPASSDRQESFDVLQSSLECEILQPTVFLSPEEVLRLPLTIWSSTDGSLPSITSSIASEDPRDSVRMELLKASTNAATSRLLRLWATRVQELLRTQPPTGGDPVTPSVVPCSAFQATQSPVVLASYLALSLHPTAMSYNDLGILLSSIDGQAVTSRPSRSNSTNETIGHDLSKLYFEAGLMVDPHNAHLLANLGSYWKKEGNYEEAIRFVSLIPPALRLGSDHRHIRYYQLALAQNPEFAAPRVYLERTLREIEYVSLFISKVVVILTPFAGRGLGESETYRHIRRLINLSSYPWARVHSALPIFLFDPAS